MGKWMITFWLILVPVTLIGHYCDIKLALGFDTRHCTGHNTCR